MWRSKKFIISMVLAVVLLFASLGGVAFAQETEEGSTLWDRVAALYQQKTGDTLDQEALHESFADARAEMRQAAMENRIARLVEEGVIEQDEADEYLEWWQEKPDTPIKPGFRGHRSSRGRCVPPAPAG